MRTDAQVGLLALTLGAAALVGCGERAFPEIVGEEARRRLPESVATLVAEDVSLCLDDERSDGAYRLWVLRHPKGSWLNFPRIKGRGAVETHAIPPSALESILRRRLPTLDVGRPTEPKGRFTHWKLPDGAEVQIREIVTDHGWFASVERVAM